MLLPTAPIARAKMDSSERYFESAHSVPDRSHTDYDTAPAPDPRGRPRASVDFAADL
jgi:hypothetical protein